MASRCTCQSGPPRTESAMFPNEVAKVYCCTLFSSLQAWPLQKCDVISEIELERERCENSTAGNVTSGRSTRFSSLFYQCMWEMILSCMQRDRWQIKYFFGILNPGDRQKRASPCTGSASAHSEVEPVAARCLYIHRAVMQMLQWAAFATLFPFLDPK